MPTLLITGANRGIGLEAAAQLASLGKFDRIILTARTAQKGEVSAFSSYYGDEELQAEATRVVRTAAMR